MDLTVQKELDIVVTMDANVKYLHYVFNGGKYRKKSKKEKEEAP